MSGPSFYLLKKGDSAAASKLVEGGINGIVLTGMMQRYSSEHVTFKLENIKTEIDFGNAVVTLDYTMAAPSAPTPFPDQPSKLKLHLSKSAWLLVPPTLPATANPHSGDLFNDLVWCCTHPDELMKLSVQAGGDACVKGLEYIAYGALEFARNHNGVLALRTVNFQKLLAPILENDKVFHCIIDTASVASYGFNDKLTNLSIKAIKSPERTVLLYEGKDGKLTYRHNGSASVAFVDGPTKLVDANEARKLIWNPQTTGK